MQPGAGRARCCSSCPWRRTTWPCTPPWSWRQLTGAACASTRPASSLATLRPRPPLPPPLLLLLLRAPRPLRNNSWRCCGSGPSALPASWHACQGWQLLLGHQSSVWSCLLGGCLQLWKLVSELRLPEAPSAAAAAAAAAAALDERGQLAAWERVPYAGRPPGLAGGVEADCD